MRTYSEEIGEVFSNLANRSYIELDFFGGDALRGNTRTHPEHDG